MTQNADKPDQTDAAYGSGQTGARIMLGAVCAVCVVGLAAVFWPDDPGGAIRVADRAAQTGDEERVIITGDAVVDLDDEVPPALSEPVEGPNPEPAATGPEASGEGLSETPPETNPADEEDAAAQPDPADIEDTADDPS